VRDETGEFKGERWSGDEVENEEASWDPEAEAEAASSQPV